MTPTTTVIEPAAAATRLDKVHDTFLQLEAELRLFQHEAHGFRVWDYMRHQIFDGLPHGV